MPARPADVNHGLRRNSREREQHERPTADENNPHDRVGAPRLEGEQDGDDNEHQGREAGAKPRPVTTLRRNAAPPVPGRPPHRRIYSQRGCEGHEDCYQSKRRSLVS